MAVNLSTQHPISATTRPNDLGLQSSSPNSRDLDVSKVAASSIPSQESSSPLLIPFRLCKELATALAEVAVTTVIIGFPLALAYGLAISPAEI